MHNFERSAAIAFLIICTAISPIQKSLHHTVQAFSHASYNSVILQETTHGGVDYLNKIVFLGDSRTYGLKSFELLDGGKNTEKVWTPKSGTMSIWDMQFQKIFHPASNTEKTCAEAAAIDNPEILIISLGFNGVELVGKEYFTNEYIKLINSVKAASPTTKIILQSIFPVSRSYPNITNQSIKQGNEWILEIAKSTDSFYLNTQEVLCDKYGFLRDEYTTDGCHLTPLGLDVQIEYICTHVLGG